MLSKGAPRLPSQLQTLGTVRSSLQSLVSARAGQKPAGLTPDWDCGFWALGQYTLRGLVCAPPQAGNLAASFSAPVQFVRLGETGEAWEGSPPDSPFQFFTQTEGQVSASLFSLSCQTPKAVSKG